MSKQIGILIHPGWTDDTPDDYIEQLHKMVSRYDFVHIYLPMVAPSLKKYLFKRYANELYRYGMTGEANTIVLDIFNLDGFETILKKVAKIANDKIVYKNITVGKVNGKVNISKKHITVYVRKMYLKLGTLLSEDPKYGHIFNGNHELYPPTKAIIDNIIKTYEDNDNIMIHKYGGIGLTNNVSRGAYLKYPELLDGDVHIFGEFYNECVLSHSMMLDGLGIKNTRVKELSIYNNRSNDIDDVAHYLHVTNTSKDI